MRGQEESIRGNELIRKIKEKDLICKGGKTHIVFEGTICRPSIISGTYDRGNRIWERKQVRLDYADYTRLVSAMHFEICLACRNRLEKAGYRQRD